MLHPAARKEAVAERQLGPWGQGHPIKVGSTQKPSGILEDLKERSLDYHMKKTEAILFKPNIIL